METALFGKVYRIVTRWYGNAVEEAFDDAIIAWQTGYFEVTAVFRADDPGDVELAVPRAEEPRGEGDDNNAELTGGQNNVSSAAPTGQGQQDDPNKAGKRVDLSGVGGRGP